MKLHLWIVIGHFIFKEKHEIYFRRSLNKKCRKNILSLFEMMCCSLALKRKKLRLDLVASLRKGMSICSKEWEEVGSSMHAMRAE